MAGGRQHKNWVKNQLDDIAGSNKRFRNFLQQHSAVFEARHMKYVTRNHEPGKGKIGNFPFLVNKTKIIDNFEHAAEASKLFSIVWRNESKDYMFRKGQNPKFVCLHYF